MLEVVIADKGPGIPTTLGPVCPRTDAGLAPTECEIIEYAFAYGSSRRPIEDRVDAL